MKSQNNSRTQDPMEVFVTALRGLEKTPLPLSEATEESLNEQTEETSPQSQQSRD